MQNNAVAGPKFFFKPELSSVYFFWGERWAGHALDRFHEIHSSEYHCEHSQYKSQRMNPRKRHIKGKNIPVPV